ncbi:MAG: T9SS C-terminal target domain-containing protein [Calditrichaeota bacterium]|nr:MAG: T9SS C-terminal target domain-containing protein [Calditrichota bacterium]
MKILTLTKSVLTLALGMSLSSNTYAAKMYFTDFGTSKIQRADLDGSNVEDLVTTGLSAPSGISLDVINSKMYWIDFGIDKIKRADFDGSNVEDIITGLNFPRNIAVDATNSKIYWVDIGTDKVHRADLDGSNVEDIVTGIAVPLAVEVDVVNSKVYWADNSSNRIQRAGLDGSNVEDIITSGLNTPTELALDVFNSKIYWLDDGTNKLQRANFDGSSIEDLVTGLDSPQGLAIDKANSKIYWTDDGTDKIQRANLDGSNVEDVLTTGLITPFALEIDNAVDQPLSVELNSFSARQIENSIQLSWATASETENEGFNVYRKVGSGNFAKIASYKSHNELQGQGNTSVETFYNFTDNSKLQSGEFYTYLISDVETNGLETKHEKSAQSVLFEIKTEKAKRFELAQNFPNPFNPSTTISYNLANDAKVILKIYNEKGEFVKELTNGFRYEGSHNVVWNGTDSFGNQVSSGTYFYKLTSGTFTQTNKMILLK